MSDQISFLDLGAPMSPEEALYQNLMPCMRAAMLRGGVADQSIELVPMKGYYSIMLAGKYLVCRVHFGKKQNHISFRRLRQNKDVLLSPFRVSQTKTDKDSGFIRVILQDTNVTPDLQHLICAVMKNTIDSIPREYDCCSRYLECSNAKHCIHPSSDFALGCGYRRILNSGRIFYGKNRNID